MRGLIRATEPIWKECARAFLKSACETLGNELADLAAEKVRDAVERDEADDDE